MKELSGMMDPSILVFDEPNESEYESDGLSNAGIAEALEEIADRLEMQQANQFRVAAYRRGAVTIRSLEVPVDAIVEKEGTAGLIRLPHIGHSLASSITQLCETGRLALLDRLRGESVVESLFSSIPGIGPELAERIHEQLDIETLAELEAAVYDGSLLSVAGIGRKRLQAVKDAIAARGRRQPPVKPSAVELREGAPSVEELLDVDDEYRQKADRDQLVRIAPRRFNPTQTAWLPILHTTREDRHYTALYSNTARAHELGTTRDWVVIYRDDASQGRWTVITSRLSQLKGKRIVRGREDECREFYARHKPEVNGMDRDGPC